MMKYETDSRLVKEGQTFVAINGYTVDGHDYIDAAIKNGANNIIMEREITISVPSIVVESSEDYLKKKLIEEYSKDLKDLKIVGITGTNGKTTTCYLVYQHLKYLGKKAAYIGTVGFYCNDEFRELNNTTPDILNLYKLFFEAKEKGIEYVVMEVSSHALSFERIAGLKFEVAAFTNLSQDHLDFHKTMEEYLNAKAKITDYLVNDGFLITNGDDKASDALIYKNTLKVGLNGDYKILDCNYNADSTIINFSKDDVNYNVKTNLINSFNVYNYLMSLAVVNSLGYSIEEIIEHTDKVYPPAGRCETIKVNQSFAVIDFAHTPDAVEKIIKAYKELNVGRVITILGCGGDRDAKKRPIMGSLATSLSDEVIFTSDNPRTENPEDILKDIVRGNTSSNFRILIDREEAIKNGLQLLTKNDFLLILGKGHEKYQIIGHEKKHFDDSEMVKIHTPKESKSQFKSI